VGPDPVSIKINTRNTPEEEDEEEEELFVFIGYCRGTQGAPLN